MSSILTTPCFKMFQRKKRAYFKLDSEPAEKRYCGPTVPSFAPTYCPPWATFGPIYPWHTLAADWLFSLRYAMAAADVLSAAEKKRELSAEKTCQNLQASPKAEQREKKASPLVASQPNVPWNKSQNEHSTLSADQTMGGQDLRHLQVLSSLSRCRKDSGYGTSQATECRLCGNCSFATAGYQLAFMKQHLYTHLTSPLFSCAVCSEYKSNAKNRVLVHLRRAHGAQFAQDSKVLDHRYELDEQLVALSKQCYGSHIVSRE